MLCLNSLLMAAGLIACFYMTVFVLSHKSPSIFLKTLSPIGCKLPRRPLPQYPRPHGGFEVAHEACGSGDAKMVAKDHKCAFVAVNEFEVYV